MLTAHPPSYPPPPQITNVWLCVLEVPRLTYLGREASTLAKSYSNTRIISFSEHLRDSSVFESADGCCKEKGGWMCNCKGSGVYSTVRVNCNKLWFFQTSQTVSQDFLLIVLSLQQPYRFFRKFAKTIVTSGIVDTGGNLPPVSLTPVENLPQVSLHAINVNLHSSMSIKYCGWVDQTPYIWCIYAEGTGYITD